MRGILLYALGIPAALVALIHALFKEDSADSHRAFGYLLDGSSADFFYIQLVIILLMASSLVFGNYLTLGTLFRVVWLLGVYSSYSLVISAIKPFDARDKNARASVGARPLRVDEQDNRLLFLEAFPFSKPPNAKWAGCHLLGNIHLGGWSMEDA
ncbi:unnamed protein product [Effrenium voratum]|nr:unnamed protein product [Effrenium voratum]